MKEPERPSYAQIIRALNGEYSDTEEEEQETILDAFFYWTEKDRDELNREMEVLQLEYDNDGYNDNENNVNNDNVNYDDEGSDLDDEYAADDESDIESDTPER